jgi:two-component system cell cycle response regulator DivK
MAGIILLVEDNEMNRDMLSRRLERIGFTVLTANDGQEGLNSACQNQPDLILLDMSLPIISGWDVSTQLKAKEETKQIPIIALTAHAMEEDKRKALDAGCNEFETKPIDFTRLVEKIRLLLGL